MYFSPDSHFLGVAAEGFDVLLDPLEGETLVAESEVCVAGVLIRGIST